MIPDSCFRPVPNTIELINRKGLMWHYDKRGRVRYLKPTLREERYYCYNIQLTNGKRNCLLVNNIMRLAGFKPIEKLAPWYKRTRRFVDRYQELGKLPKPPEPLVPSQIPNGRYCHYCNQPLYGGYFWACPACWLRLASTHRDEGHSPGYNV